MPYRHRPFGVAEAELRKLLDRRFQSHRRRLAPRARQMAQLRADGAEISGRLSGVEQAIANLEAEAQTLRRDLDALDAEPGAAGARPGPADSLDQLQMTLQYYRTLHTEIRAGVLALIAPFLVDPNETEGPEWPSIRTAGR